MKTKIVHALRATSSHIRVSLEGEFCEPMYECALMHILQPGARLQQQKMIEWCRPSLKFNMVTS